MSMPQSVPDHSDRAPYPKRVGLIYHGYTMLYPSKKPPLHPQVIPIADHFGQNLRSCPHSTLSSPAKFFSISLTKMWQKQIDFILLPPWLHTQLTTIPSIPKAPKACSTSKFVLLVACPPPFSTAPARCPTPRSGREVWGQGSWDDANPILHWCIYIYV